MKDKNISVILALSVLAVFFIIFASNTLFSVSHDIGGNLCKFSSNPELESDGCIHLSFTCSDTQGNSIPDSIDLGVGLYSFNLPQAGAQPGEKRESYQFGNSWYMANSKDFCRFIGGNVITENGYSPPSWDGLFNPPYCDGSRDTYPVDSFGWFCSAPYTDLDVKVKANYQCGTPLWSGIIDENKKINFNVESSNDAMYGVPACGYRILSPQTNKITVKMEGLGCDKTVELPYGERVYNRWDMNGEVLICKKPVQVCSPGTYSCDNGKYNKCKDDGSGYNTVVCEFGCSENEGICKNSATIASTSMFQDMFNFINDNILIIMLLVALFLILFVLFLILRKMRSRSFLFLILSLIFKFK